MKDYNPSFNPFSSENLFTSLIALIILVSLPILIILIDRYIIPKLGGEDDKIVKWWKKHIVDINPFEK